MIFIDWISTPYHANFNRSFFAAIKTRSAKLIVFSNKLIIDQIECEVKKDNGGRAARALSVLKICYQLRNERIVLLTYDPLFVPIVSLIIKHPIVFEHNTVPEEIGLNKHAIWQFIFFRRIFRLAQFSEQCRIMKLLKQKCWYIGSPLLKQHKHRQETGREHYYIAPSYRFDVNGLRPALPFIQGHKVIVKCAAINDDHDVCSSGIIIDPVDHIDLTNGGQNIKGMIITIQSRVRGTGWFNDAISLCVPIIVTNQNARCLFEETFPDYPYVDVADCEDQDSFNMRLQEIALFDPACYIEKHNNALRDRFEKFLKYISQ